MTMRYLTAAQMREADRRCIEDIGIPGAVLMNNAGMAVFREIDQEPVGIICGRGNNGGDGFVVARLAMEAGLSVRVLLAADPEAIRGDARTFLTAYRNLGGRVDVAETPAAAVGVLKDFGKCGLLVDALLGTGIQGEVRGLCRHIIEAWPPVHTIAVDLPSGLDADTGTPCGVCVRAATTVTFQCPKIGFRNPASHAYLGRLVVADIGIPARCIDIPEGTAP